MSQTLSAERPCSMTVLGPTDPDRLSIEALTASEIAVAPLPEKRIGFADITAIGLDVVAALPVTSLDSLYFFFAVDEEACHRTADLIARRFTHAR